MSDSAPEPTRKPDARHQTAVPSQKRLAFAGITSLGVSVLTLAYVISEYGSRVKDISDGLIENVCSINQQTLWDEFVYRLIGCRTVYESVVLQGHRFFIPQSYFNDPCQIKYGVTDHIDCSQFLGLTALFRLPAAMYYTIHRLLIDSGVIGLVLVFILPLSFLVWIGFKKRDPALRELHNFAASWPFSLVYIGTPLKIVAAYVAIGCIFFALIAFSTFLYQSFLVLVLGIISGLLSILLFVVFIPALIFFWLKGPVEIVHGYHAWKQLRNRISVSDDKEHD